MFTQKRFFLVIMLIAMLLTAIFPASTRALSLPSSYSLLATALNSIQAMIEKLEEQVRLLQEQIGQERPPTVSKSSLPERLKWVPGELVVEFKPGISKKTAQKLAFQYGATLPQEIPKLNAFVLRLPEADNEKIALALARHPFVAEVSKNYLFEPVILPNDSFYNFQWHHGKIANPAAWDITTGNSNQVIAILDSGVDTDHPDLSQKLLPGWDFYGNDGNYEDICGHGTRVAGTAAALTNNALGVAGVAWQPKILPLKIANDDVSCRAPLSAIGSALVYAADQGVRIANISYGIFDGRWSAFLNNSLNYFYSKGGLVFVAGGNTGAEYPAEENPALISISATDTNDVITSWSTWGNYIDLAAPGSGIYTTAKDGLYAAASGTSFASPIAAGVGALVWAANPQLSVLEVEKILETTAVDLGMSGYDPHYGWGRIDAQAAVNQARGTTPLPDTTPPTVSIVKPGANSLLRDSVEIEIAAFDDVEVARVELWVDGTLLASDFSPPWSFIWETKLTNDGLHQLMAQAFDPSLNGGSSSPLTVTIDNTPPVVSITEPLAGSTVYGKITFAVEANDANGIERVEFLADNLPIASDNSAPYSLIWDSTTVVNGAHTLSGRAYDRALNSATAILSVNVANAISDMSPPAVSIAEPKSGASFKIGSLIAVKVKATDNVGISRIELYIDGALRFTDTSLPYEFSWDTSKERPGRHSLQVRATDGAGNQTLSNKVNIKLQSFDKKNRKSL